MQEQMSGAGMMTPPDPNKAFKAEWEALEIVNHQWCLLGVEDELVDSHIPPETIYIKNKSTLFLYYLKEPSYRCIIFSYIIPKSTHFYLLIACAQYD